jgi:hypothetical protein
MATNQTAAQGNARQAPPPAAPFRVGTQNTTLTDGYTVTQTIPTTATQLTPYNPSANAFLKGIYIQANCTGTNSSATTAFNADAPWNVFSQISFNDTQGKPLLLVNGYELMLINKFGGYGLTDPRANATFTQTTGDHSAGGSFEFVLYVPLELVSRDGIGSLPNKNQASPFQLQLTVNTSANIYSTAPDGGASLVVTCLEDGYWQPQAADAQGNPYSQNPPDVGATQYWLRNSYNAASGNNQIQLTGGLGFSLRNIIFENYSVSGTSRATGQTDWPDPAQLLYKGTNFKNMGKNVWDFLMCNWFGLTSTGTASGAVTPTFDSANGLENGIFVLPFNIDFAERPGAELRNGYLVTQQADQFALIGSWSAACTLYELVNYVASPDGNPNSLRANR